MTNPDRKLIRAEILEFRYPVKPGRWSDKQRILAMHESGEIDKDTLEQWLKNGGHK